MKTALAEHSKMPILSMSPRNDVNRSVKLATWLGTLQHNIVLDSGIGRKESVRPAD